MSPHVANFVHDLVAMAKAMEENPVLQEQIDALRAQLGQAQDHNAGLEVNIISYKQQIDDLQAKVRSLEVERDDASFRVLEAEDKANLVLAKVSSLLTGAEEIYNLVKKPEPVVEPEPILPQAVPSEPNREGLEYDKATDAWYPKASPPDATQGQSEASPTVEPSSPVSSTPQSDSVVSIVEPKPQGTPAFGHFEPDGALVPVDADPEPTPRYSYEWYQWNDRRNERAAKAASGH